MTPVSPSARAVAPLAWTQRLVEQLQLISEVTEALTYRLLELEERLAEGERQLASLREQVESVQEVPAAMESWLEQTDERLVRVEQLLRRGESRPSPVSGRALVAVSAAAGSAAVTSPEDSEADPSPGEGEQVFLDAQSA